MTILNYLFKDNPKRKLLAFALVFVMIAAAIGLYVVNSISKINRAYQLTAEVQKALNLVNKADLDKKEFLQAALSGGGASTAVLTKNQFDTTLLQVKNIITNQVMSSILSSSQEVAVQQILTDVAKYKAMFHRIINLNTVKENPSTGLTNQMNVALQAVEFSDLPVNMVPVVFLKRCQADFEEKRDLRFFQSFQEESALFLSDVESFNVTTSAASLSKETLLKNMRGYVSTFEKIVGIEKEIGLSDKDGLKGKLAATFQALDANMNHLNKIIEARSLSIAESVRYSIVFLFLFIVVAIVLILRYFIRQVYNPLIEIQRSADQIAHGDLNINLEKIRKNNLLKEIVGTFGKMVNKLEITLHQIEEIARLNLSNEIELSSEKDMIGKSLANVQKQLYKFTEDERLAKLEDEKRSWATEGLAMFSNYLRGNGDLKGISQSIISNLVKYLKANQGGLYIVNIDEEGTKYIELMACYAYDRLKHINKRIEVGEGLVGQCYFEGESIYMNDVPESYVKISSGLGDANPRCILIVPAKINDKIEAILEIALFIELEAYQISFVEKLAENIASTIWSIQVNEKTKRLLQESQFQTEDMKSKEEEMQQNIEEMASIQEELNRKEKYYQARIEELEMGLHVKLN
ncbi:GAF domain-containing protein [Williamwhitmania taraxaci]|uniref:GAF domain-containing protein n=2 Tax=Williamwhitmania taraxaci TaxID=1640674 RepID=A0A1G6H8L2_9BACT|nr:GAF domain-containing protein [Williamwhitmania taraxaci]